MNDQAREEMTSLGTISSILVNNGLAEVNKITRSNNKVFGSDRE
jgi:hypothetical protein